MFFFVCGLPGAFADWCDTVTTELVGRAVGPTRLIRAETLDDLARCVIETGAHRAVVSSRRPGGRLWAGLLRHGRRFIVALDDPGPALADLVLGQGVGLAAAIQGIAGSCAALAEHRSAPGALVLRRDRDWPPAAATIAAIARHLQIVVDPAEIAELAAGLAAPDETRQHDAVAWWNGLSQPHRATATGALMAFIEPSATGQPMSLTWTHGLFFHGDRPDEAAIGPIDISGRAHCVLSGPYILLPPGAWSLSLTMLFSRAAAEHEFLVEIGADGPLASGTIRPQHEGSAELTIDFVLGEATERPVALRVNTLRAAFDGAITVVAATVRRAGPAADMQAPTRAAAGK
jgi:hypothetical protein